MNKGLNFFPKLEYEDVQQINPKITYSFFYQDPKETQTTEISFVIDNRKNILLDTKENNWNPYSFDLTMKVDLRFDDISFLYGSCGIAPTNSELSICLEWFSRKSKTRGIIKLPNSIQTYNGHVTFSKNFEKNIFASDIEINIYFYLRKKADKLLQEESFLNNQVGIILGELDKKTIFMVGNSSMFPIYTKPLETPNLWELEINYEEPDIDMLNDSVKLILNSNHRDFNLLDVSNKNYCERLIYEIIAQSITVLIVKLKEDGCLKDIQGDFSDGTVLSFVKYYKEMLGLSIDNISSISSSLRNFLEGKV